MENTDSRFSKFIRKLDFLSSPPTLKINQNRSFTTAIGGLLTVILTILIFIGAIYFGQELWRKKDPLIYISKAERNQFSRVNLNNEEFYFSVGVEDKNYVFYNDPSIFTMKAVNVELIKNSTEYTYQSKEVELQPCSNYFKNSSDLTDSIIFDLTTMFCIKPNATYLENFYGHGYYSSLEVHLLICKNNTSLESKNQTTCKTPEEIDEKLNQGTITVFASNYILNSKDYNSPLKRVYSNFWNTINPLFMTFMIYDLSGYEYITDVGFLLEDLSKLDKFYITEKLMYFQKDETGLLNKVYFRGTNYSDRVMRTYDKIQHVLTKIGGLLKALTVISSIIANISSQIESSMFLIFFVEWRNNYYSKDKIKKSDFFRNNLQNNINDINNKNIENIIGINKVKNEELNNSRNEINNLDNIASNMGNIKLKQYSHSVNILNDKVSEGISRQDINNSGILNNQSMVGSIKINDWKKEESEVVGNKLILSNNNVNNNRTNNIAVSLFQNNMLHDSSKSINSFKKEDKVFETPNNKSINVLKDDSNIGKNSPYRHIVDDSKFSNYNFISNNNNLLSNNNNQFGMSDELFHAFESYYNQRYEKKILFNKLANKSFKDLSFADLANKYIKYLSFNKEYYIKLKEMEKVMYQDLSVEFILF